MSLFEIEEALEKGTIICYLLSDAAQIKLWPTVEKYLTKGKALYFSHGFGITFNRSNRHYAAKGCGCVPWLRLKGQVLPCAECFCRDAD